MEPCPCGSGRDFAACCEPIIIGNIVAPTAEALMRSRYSAYATGAIDHIIDSCTGGREDLDVASTRRWSERSTWQGLQVHRVEKGGPADAEGLVEFTATYVMDGLREEHREVAKFERRDGRWLYASGEVVPRTVVREGPKVGRNEPCPCGSGKKYKQCHGK